MAVLSLLFSLLACACMDEAQTSVSRAKALSPVSTLAPGKGTELAVQFLDADGKGVNGVECLFLSSNADALAFDDAPTSSSTRVMSRAGSVAQVEADGLAVVRVTAKPTSAPVDVTVWAGLASSQVLADEADPSASEIFALTVHVVPDAADSGVEEGP